MPFCPKCGAPHDPNLPCFDRVAETTQEMGVETSEKSNQDFQALQRIASRSLLKSLLLLMLGLALLVMAVILFRR